MDTTLHHTDEVRIKVIDTFNRLIMSARDAEAGYRTACECTHDLELQEIFTKLARRREAFVEILSEEIERLDGDVADKTTLTGALHRGWMNLRVVFSKNGAHAMLAECERSEDGALKVYDAVLATVILDSIQRDIVAGQRALVQEAHDQIKMLRDHPGFGAAK